MGYWLFGLNEVFAFWFAYIMARPLGASFADWLGRSHGLGGMELDTGRISLALAITVAGLVGYLTVTRKDVTGNTAYPRRQETRFYVRR